MKMNSKIILTVFTVLTLIYSCQSKQQEGVASPEKTLEMMKSKPLPPQAEPDDVVMEPDGFESVVPSNKPSMIKKIIKDGSMSAKTNDINLSKRKIDSLLIKFNAYYENENLENNDNTISIDLKIRVPANNFEKLISSIENGNDEIKSKSVQARDVTEEYVDIETRLANKREYLKRYKELLSKALTVKDILEIEENIRTLQEEIESKEGQLKFLNDQVSFSSLELNLFKEKEFVYKPQPKDNFLERVKKSLNNGWESVVNFMLWLVAIWPFIVLALISAYIFKRVVKYRKNKQLNK